MGQISDNAAEHDETSLIIEVSNWYSVMVRLSFKLIEGGRGKAQLAVSWKKSPPSTLCFESHHNPENIKVFQSDGIKVTQAMLLNHFLRPTISFLPFKSITLPPYCLTTSQSCFYHIYVVRLNICIKLAQSLLLKVYFHICDTCGSLHVDHDMKVHTITYQD